MAGADLTPSSSSASSSPTHIASSASGATPGVVSDALVCKFRALLEPRSQASVGGRVDSAALREAALSGVPVCVRAQVWTRLLSLTPRDYGARREALDTHAAAVRAVCAALRRARVVRAPVPPISDDAFTLATTTNSNAKSRRLVLPSAEHVLKFIGVIGVYLESAGSDVEFHTDMVYLAAVFIEVMSTEADAYNAFSAVMRAQRHMYTSHGIRRAVTELAAGLRYLYSDLHEAFVSEEVDINLWAPSWLRSMLARQLPRDAVLRLWDALFAKHQRDWSLLHPYICLALLGEMRADLQDCDDSERILALLSRPRVGDAADPARIITSANAIREKLKSAGVI